MIDQDMIMAEAVWFHIRLDHLFSPQSVFYPYMPCLEQRLQHHASRSVDFCIFSECYNTLGVLLIVTTPLTHSDARWTWMLAWFYIDPWAFVRHQRADENTNTRLNLNW